MDKELKLCEVFSGYTNHSGGAMGADTEWGKIGSKFGVESKHYYFNIKTPNGNVRLNNGLKNEAMDKYRAAAKFLNRSVSNKAYAIDLISRNWFQVKHAKSILVIGYFEDNGVHIKGGSGYTVAMAILEKKEVYVYDQIKEQWYYWNYKKNSWVISTTPKLTKNFAGVGSRDLLESGKKAIKDVYFFSIVFKGITFEKDAFEYLCETMTDSVQVGINMKARQCGKRRNYGV